MFPLQHFIAPALELMPCLHSQQRREAIKAFSPLKTKVAHNSEQGILIYIETFSMCLLNKMDLIRVVKFTSPALKLTSPA